MAAHREKVPFPAPPAAHHPDCSSVATIFSLGGSEDTSRLPPGSHRGADLDRSVAKYKAGRLSASELKEILSEAFGSQVRCCAWEGIPPSMTEYVMFLVRLDPQPLSISCIGCSAVYFYETPDSNATHSAFVMEGSRWFLGREFVYAELFRIAQWGWAGVCRCRAGKQLFHAVLCHYCSRLFFSSRRV